MVRLTAQELPFDWKIRYAILLPAVDTLKIAIQGERGSFSHQAALRFVPDAEVVPCVLSREVFERVLRGEVDAIAIPLENSLAGAVVEHYDLLREHPVLIERETVLRIEHHVIGVPGSRIEEIRHVYSHPVALAQCRNFFREHPLIEPTSFYDTAGAVQHVLTAGDRSAAGIASMQAATIYGGAVLVEGVEDDAANYTRFVLARAQPRGAIPQGEHKLSLCVELEPRPGKLLRLLSAVEELEGNVTQLQTRPVQGQPWRYHLFLDTWLPHAAATQRLLEQMPALCARHKLLGHYQAAPEFGDIRTDSW